MYEPRIRSAIESLVLCESCTHGIGSHDGRGCSQCRCALTRELVVEQALSAARDEIKELWGAPVVRT
jgi:hypothetical protein